MGESMTIDRRNPYKPFDESLIQDFLRGRKVLSAELLTSGKINSNYKLALDDGTSYVCTVGEALNGKITS